MITSRLINDDSARGLLPKDDGDDQPFGLTVLLGTGRPRTRRHHLRG
jgi:hypothetical protein